MLLIERVPQEGERALEKGWKKARVESHGEGQEREERMRRRKKGHTETNFIACYSSVLFAFHSSFLFPCLYSQRSSSATVPSLAQRLTLARRSLCHTLSTPQKQKGVDSTTGEGRDTVDRFVNALVVLVVCLLYLM